MSVSMLIGGQPIGDTGSPRVVPSSLQLLADVDANNIAGPSAASFLIVADPKDPLPALAYDTPVSVDVDGQRAWSGRILTAVRTGHSVAVSCQGTKTDLDNPLITLLSLDMDLSRWRGLYTLVGDASLYDARPNNWVSAGPGAELVSSSAQGLTLTWPATAAGFTQNSLEAVVAVDVDWPFGVTGALIAVSFSASIAGRFRVWSTNQLAAVSTRSDSLDIADTVRMGVYAVTIPAARYLKLGWGWSTSSSSAGAVCTVSVIWLTGAAPAAFQTADQVAREVAALVPQLSSDLSQISTTPTLIGQSAWPDPGTAPSAILAQLAAFDDPLLAVDAGDRLVFKPRSGVPALELGAKTPVSSEAPSDPSVLVSEVIVSGTDLSGQPYAGRFTPLDLPETGLVVATAVSVPNGQFGAGTAPWATVATSALINGGGFLEWRLNNGPTYSPAIPHGDYIVVALTGTFQAGVPVLLEFTIDDPTLYAAGKEALVAHVLDVLLLDTGDLPGMAERQIRVPPSPATFRLSWTPRKTTSTAALYFFNSQSKGQVYSDGKYAYYCLGPNLSNVVLYQAAIQGPLTSQGVTRTGLVSISSVANDAVALALAQSYLRGSIRQGPTSTRVAADGAALDPVSHAPLSAASVLASVGQLARNSDRNDPVTGAVGAIEYVSAVTYDHSSRRCQITQGQRYGDYAALLARTGG